MRIVLVEFTWQANKIINNKEYYKNDVIVSLDPGSSYIFKVNNIEYLENSHFCNHNKLWENYKNITDQSLKITKVLDEALWNIDSKFKKLNWKIFDDYHFFLKVSFDQLYYYAELISELVKKYKPSEFIIADSKKIEINDNLMISSKISIFKFLLQSQLFSRDKIKVQYMQSDFKEIRGNKTLKFTFLNFSNVFNKEYIKKILKNHYFKLKFFLSYYFFKCKYLSIGCHEIEKFKKLYPKESNNFLSYNHENFKSNQSCKNWPLFDKFINYLKFSTSYKKLVKHQDISFEFIFNKILFQLTRRLNFFIKEHKKALEIVKRVKPSCVIFQTMTPFFSANIVFRKICNDLKIPFATWSHGGYGATFAIPHYDVTDFRLCKNHITFGTHLEKVIKDEKCILKQLNFHKNHKLFAVGSARLDYDNRNQILKNNLKNTGKQTILFALSAHQDRNTFYFGRNRKRSENSLWQFHYEILNLLKKYQNRYNIIFKDYPNGCSSLWKRAIKDVDANQILYISNQKTINDLLRISDLNIFPWISTTFFEALYFDADIFVIEEDLFSKHFSKESSAEIFCYNNELEFKQKLEQYLEIGKFYKLQKKNSKNYFMQLGEMNNKDKLLYSALSKFSYI